MATLKFGEDVYEVEYGPQRGNTRSLRVPAIPLEVVVERISRTDYPEVRYSSSLSRLDLPNQELYSWEEFDVVLDDEAMPGHANFALGRYARSIREGEI